MTGATNPFLDDLMSSKQELQVPVGWICRMGRAKRSIREMNIYFIDIDMWVLVGEIK